MKIHCIELPLDSIEVEDDGDSTMITIWEGSDISTVILDRAKLEQLILQLQARVI